MGLQYSRTMSDESQIEIPPSFVALYVPPGRIKPTLARAELSARYELCEDMAQMLVDTAQTLQFQLGVTEADELIELPSSVRFSSTGGTGASAS